MDEDVLLSLVEESSSVYNIKHRAFYFAKEVVLFMGNRSMNEYIFSI